MTESHPGVILYRYDTSPYAMKVDHVLFLKRIPYKRVNVSNIMPRPEITQLLGLGYRRIPVLAIGNDLYCETSLIASALERHFPPTKGFNTIFPPSKSGGNAHTGLIKAFSRHYVDTFLFSASANLIPWSKVPPAFIKDRSELRGVPLDPEGLKSAREKFLATLSSHLFYIEEQLADGREWLFDTTTPSLADISVAFLFIWIKSTKWAPELFNVKKFPLTMQWLAHYAEYINNLPDKKFETISGADAAKSISQATFQSYNTLGFDRVEATRLGLKAGDVVTVTSNETGKRFGTTGKLVALNDEELVIEVQGAYGVIRVHFPRIGYTAEGERLANKL